MILTQWLNDLERILDRFAAKPVAQLCLLTFNLIWAIIERGDVGFDGVLTMLSAHLLLAIRREQGRRDPRDDAVDECE